MRPKELKQALLFLVENRMPVLVKGAPGIGKTDIIEDVAHQLNYNLIVSHPVVSDPTDYKGLPFPSEKRDKATFLPFGELQKIITADRPTIFFLDDLGQAPASVQAAAMQLLLARKINNHSISKQVTFVAATNRRQDKAAVQGILEPVKSRFASIIELQVNLDDWCKWALTHGMPQLLVSFVRFRPALLHDFKATADITNTPCPRTVAYVGKMIAYKMPEETKFELIEGAAGKGFAAEYISFEKIYKDLPDINKLLKNPENFKIPEDQSTLYAISGAIAAQVKKSTFDNAMKYVKRMPKEFQVMSVKDIVSSAPSLANTEAFQKWAIANTDILILDGD